MNLVSFNQSKTDADRTHYYDELCKIPKFRDVKRIERFQYEYYSRWYCVPIRGP